MGVYMCASVRGVRAVIGTQDYQEEGFSVVGKSSRSALQPQTSIQQYSSSNTTATVLQALAFVPVVTVYVRVAGAQQQQMSHDNST